MMSSAGNHHTDARCKECLTSPTVPKADIAVVYGATTTCVHHGKSNKSSEVLLWGAPQVVPSSSQPSHILKERKEAGKRTTAVWLIAADAQTECPMEELVARLNNPHADRPLRWLAFSNGAIGGYIRYQKSYGTHGKKQLQGSQSQRSDARAHP